MIDLKNLFNRIEYHFWCSEIYSHDLNRNQKQFSLYSDRLTEDREIVLSLYDNRDTEDTIYDLYFNSKFIPTKTSNHCHITVCGDEYVVEDMNDQSKVYSFKDTEECAKFITESITYLTLEWMRHTGINTENIFIINQPQNILTLRKDI
ncbi:hypothetical protein EB001_09790 [bacterium]|nr:hypothetical protein [bacterium]